MYQLTERALQLLMNLFIAKIRERLLAKDYPYGNPDVKGSGDKYASGQLYNSLSGSIEIGPNGEPIALIEYADYFNNVNRGRKAGVKRVPISALMQWIKIRGLKQTIEQQRKGIAYAINKSREKNNKHKIPFGVLEKWVGDSGLQMTEQQSSMSLAFAVQKNIFKYGVRPANIYDAGISDLEQYFDNFPNNLPPDLLAEGEDIFEAVAEDINAFIEQTLTKEIQTINNIR
jgi:hypothetical protein